MMLKVYCYYNKLLEAFGNFQLDDHEPEKVKIGISRDLRANWLQGKADNFRHLDLYVLGTFDDETGVFSNDKHLVLSLGDLIAQFEASKVKENESNS